MIDSKLNDVGLVGAFAQKVAVLKKKLLGSCKHQVEIRIMPLGSFLI